MAFDDKDEVEFADYVEMLKRRWAWFVAPLLALPLLAYGYSVSRAERFDASAQVLLSDSAAQDAIVGVSQNTSFRTRVLENEINLARGDGAIEEIAVRLGVSTDEVPDFDVSADSSSDVLLFSANRPTADGAAVLANVAAESYVFLKKEEARASIVEAVATLELNLAELQTERDLVRADLSRLEDELAQASDETRPQTQALVDREAGQVSGQIASIDAQIASTSESITQLELIGDLALGGTVRILSTANPPTESSNSSSLRFVAFGVLAGAILGATLALVRENLDNKVRSSDDLHKCGLVTLGSIPKATSSQNKTVNLALISRDDPAGPQAQAHQKVRAALRFLTVQHGLKNVLITSAVQGEGKTTLASNLAISMARSNTRTVVVDLDLRRPRLHSAYGLEQSHGITSVVVDGVDGAEAAHTIDGLAGHLTVVTAGPLPPHPESFINSTAFTDTVEDLTKLWDFTVFDAPPVLPVADTLSLAQVVDGVILVAYANETLRDDLTSAVESLRASGAQVLGGVLLGAEDERAGYGYYESAHESFDRM